MYQITSPRLRLRAYRKNDFPDLYAIFSNEDIMRYLFAGQPFSESETRDFIAERFIFGPYPTGLGSLCLRDDGHIVGIAGIVPCTCFEETEYEFGFALHPDHRGKGYAVEIGRAQIAFGFEKLTCKRMLALVHPHNAASLKVVSRLGMRLLKKMVTADRGPRDIYSIELGEFDPVGSK